MSMNRTKNELLRAVPSIDELLRIEPGEALAERYGRELMTSVLREVADDVRAALVKRGEAALDEAAPEAMVEVAADRIAVLLEPRLKPVFNLTGTVLHTNLGRAPLPVEAIAAMTTVARGASNLEYDLDTGRRGDRDSHLEDWICRLTGAEAATVVNNNAAAVLLLLNTLARRKEVPVSRGELVEIGGAFRIPDVMARAGSKLVEVGSTNRTHLADYDHALNDRTALVMKVHTSNYVIEGFTAEVTVKDLAARAHAHDIPMAVDLGSGTLVDLTRYGLPREPTVVETLADGADLVTFSGDKLLGGPQSGIIAGRRDLVRRIKRNPMKRALRVDKLTIAALAAVLRLYADPARLTERLPALRLLTRTADEIETLARHLVPVLQIAVGDKAKVNAVSCKSQIGSGALPVDLLASFALRVELPAARGRAIERLAQAFRRLPIPVIGRIDDGAFVMDLRCLDDERRFIEQLRDVSHSNSLA